VAALGIAVACVSAAPAEAASMDLAISGVKVDLILSDPYYFFAEEAGPDTSLALSVNGGPSAPFLPEMIGTFDFRALSVGGRIILEDDASRLFWGDARGSSERSGQLVEGGDTEETSDDVWFGILNFDFTVMATSTSLPFGHNGRFEFTGIATAASGWSYIGTAHILSDGVGRVGGGHGPGEPDPVPEPAALALAGLGAVGVLARPGRRRSA